MSDLISRQWLMECIDEGWIKFDTEKDANIYIHLVRDIAPSAQPEQLWIPSGEKPPEEGSYLVWMPFAPPKHRMAVAEHCGGYWNIKTPISAWMPLPEPYREGGAE